jgi:DNA invertase Pin-like site-specific DNA recombinase
VLERRGNWRIIAEFTEVERGKRSDHPALDEAMAAAPVHQVPLVVAKVDRLTRSVAFLLRLFDRGEVPNGTTEPPIRMVPFV